MEGIRLQVKAASKDTLLGIILRSPNPNNELFPVFLKLINKEVNLYEGFKHSTSWKLEQQPSTDENAKYR